MSMPAARGAATVRVGLIGAGVLAIGWGVGQLAGQSLSDLLSAAAWFVVPAIVSDLLLLPVVALAGAAMTRRLAPWVRLPAQVALSVIGGLTVVALPFLTGIGRQADNPSLLNRNYPLGLAVYVLVILVVAGGWALVRRPGRAPRTDPPPGELSPPETTW